MNQDLFTDKQDQTCPYITNIYLISSWLLMEQQLQFSEWAHIGKQGLRHSNNINWSYLCGRVKH